jgi:hypothetical protein
VIGAQFSTSHSQASLPTIERALGAFAGIIPKLDLDILIIDAQEVPELFGAFIFGTISPGTVLEELVVNRRGEQSRDWAEQNLDVQETFRFACPNNPQVRTDIGPYRQFVRPQFIR